MTNINTLIIAGNLIRDPELKQFPSGKTVCHFSIAHNSRRFDKQSQQWKDGDPLYVECDAWGRLASAIAGNYHKGARLILTGALEPNEWTGSDGVKHKSMRLLVTAAARQPTNPEQNQAKATPAPPTMSQPAYNAPVSGGEPWAAYSGSAYNAPDF